MLLFNKQVYMVQSKDYNNGTNDVCLLLQGLYGLKQSPKLWYDKLAGFLREIGFTQSQWDAGLWFCRERNMYLTVYVNDIKLLGPDNSVLTEIAEQIAKAFDIKDLGKACHYLRIKVVQSDNSISLSQEAYINHLLEKYGITNCNPAFTPIDPGFDMFETSADPCDENKYRTAVGELQFLASYTCPDLSFPVSLLACFNSCPTIKHYKQVKHLWQYLS